MSYIFKSEDAFGLARAIGIETHEHGDELFFKFCPKCKGGDHHDKDTFSINLKTGLFKCFRAGCDYRGHFVELARDFDYDLGFGEKRFTGSCRRSRLWFVTGLLSTWLVVGLVQRCASDMS